MRVFNPRKLRLARAIDALGRLVFRLRGSGDSGTLAPLRQLVPRRILVLESHLIGDIVMAIPALRALRDRYPSADIILVAGPWAKELLQDQGLVNDFVEVRFPWSTYDYSPSNLRELLSVVRTLRTRSWDLGIDLRGDMRNIMFLFLTGAVRRVSYDFTGGEYLLSDVVHPLPSHRHIVDYNAHLVEQLGCRVPSKEPTLAVSERQIEDARRLLGVEDAASGGFLIGIHPGASKPLRHWRAERFARLADVLLEGGGNRVLLFRGPADHEVVAEITRTMKHRAVIVDQPLHRLPALFRCCTVLVGLDSGAVHVAAAVGVPTIVLFGPAEPDRVMPMSPMASVVIKEGYVCRPCDQVHCVQADNNCMDAIQVHSVHEHILNVLAKNTRVRSGR